MVSELKQGVALKKGERFEMQDQPFLVLVGCEEAGGGKGYFA